MSTHDFLQQVRFYIHPDNRDELTRKELIQLIQKFMILYPDLVDELDNDPDVDEKEIDKIWNNNISNLRLNDQSLYNILVWFYQTVKHQEYSIHQDIPQSNKERKSKTEWNNNWDNTVFFP